MKDEVMEFLMVYGWAILVVIAAIFALAYFDVLSFDKCDYNDVTPEELVGAIHWEHKKTGEIVVCPVVAEDLFTEQCRQIVDECLG